MRYWGTLSRQHFRTWIGNLALVSISLLAGAMMLEGLSRVLLPVSPGTRTVAEDGAPINIDRYAERLPRNLRFRQVGHEFDSLMTTTDLGYRGPPAQGAPEVVFLGDSFTFGTGLHDGQTFAHLFCQAHRISCANLGRGGTGTIRQLNVLEDFLTNEGWRPREVKLFMLAMTSAIVAGNDLYDNLSEASAESAHLPADEDVPEERTGLLPSIMDARRDILAWSNLLRVVQFVWGPSLRGWLSLEPAEERMQAALDETERQLERFGGIAYRHGFEARIYILHPVQDLLWGTYPETAEAIRAIAPDTIDVVSTAPAFLDDPGMYFYSYNGHFNPAGARRVADFLADEAIEPDEEAPLAF
jgi:hypothetical protein